VDGISDFDGLYSGKYNDEVQLYAFDILALEGETYASCPFTFGRPTSPASLPDVLTASTSHPSSKARSARTCFAPLAT
jgi:hypothetical protein